MKLFLYMYYYVYAAPVNTVSIGHQFGLIPGATDQCLRLHDVRMHNGHWLSIDVYLTSGLALAHAVLGGGQW